MSVAIGRHLIPGLYEYCAELCLVGLAHEISDIVFQENDTHDIFEHLSIGVGTYPLLANQCGNTCDVVRSVPSLDHDLADPPSVIVLEILAPAKIAGAASRVAVARRGPALDVLASRGNSQM